MKVLELFGGIGSIRKAFERQNIPFKVVDYVEIDKYAVASYNAMFNENFEVQDITTWDKDIDVDFVMHGSPCQDFSLAGKQAGGDLGSGTRSSLMYETIRIVGKLRPKYVMWENVKNLLSKNHKHNFDAYIETMNILGYNSYYQVLNAKDYGIPQNRERVYTISIRKDIDKGNFTFPEKEELKLRLKDMLEEQIDEKYYLSDKAINGLMFQETLKHKPNYIENKDICTTIGTKVGAGTHFSPYIREIQLLGAYGRNFGSKGKIQDTEKECDTLQAAMGNGGGNVPLIKIKNATKLGYLEATEGDGIDISGRMEYHRGTVQKEKSQTITISGGNNVGVVLNDLRIRKLTPKECWRLMGFDDSDFEKAEKINSNTQLYKQARKLDCRKCIRKNINKFI